MVKPPFRTKTLSTKVSEEEFTQLEAAANKSGLTLSEWCREAMLAGLNGQKEKSVADLCAANGTGQALMAELVALRAILLNVLFRQANGQGLTAEEMQGLIDRADWRRSGRRASVWFKHQIRNNGEPSWVRVESGLGCD